MAVEGTVRAPVQPTEGEEKVRAAVQRLFPGAALERTPWGLEGPAGLLDRFAQAIREQRIPDTARGVLLRGQEGGRTRFQVSKQAAAAGRLNFAAREGPLGDVAVELRAASAEELTRFIDETAPDTRGWSLEARGLTEQALKAQAQEEATLDALEQDAEAPDAAETGAGAAAGGRRKRRGG